MSTRFDRMTLLLAIGLAGCATPAAGDGAGVDGDDDDATEDDASVCHGDPLTGDQLPVSDDP